ALARNLYPPQGERRSRNGAAFEAASTPACSRGEGQEHRHRGPCLPGRRQGAQRGSQRARGCAHGAQSPESHGTTRGAGALGSSMARRSWWHGPCPCHVCTGARCLHTCETSRLAHAVMPCLATNGSLLSALRQVGESEPRRGSTLSRACP